MMTLSEIKNFLGIEASDSSSDSFLEVQASIISEAIEGYCNRKFSSANYVQYFYREDFEWPVKKIVLHHFPLISISSFEEADLENPPAWSPVINYRYHLPTGSLSSQDCFFRNGRIVKVAYSAGYAQIPAIIKGVFLSIIKERFNKKQSGIDLDFGSDVQRISIPGAIAIDFDYSLNQNERKSAFGVILGNHLNVLDSFRSERVIVGSSKLTYVEGA